MISIKNLCFSYSSSQPYTLDDINLDVDKGSYLSIVGENGSGKTTLMKLILKLLKPSKGEIINSAKKIGYVPQRVGDFNLSFPITVSEMLYCHMKVLKIKDKSEISKTLKEVGMADYTNSLIGNLSGGQQQKIFIARALIGNPDLIILDEPSTGVDVKSQKDIYSLLKDLTRNKGITIITVEHNLKAATTNSTHIYKLDKGNGTLIAIKENLSNDSIYNKI
ncbi:MAG: metal ABC transporter ATP-binding protein [Bacillota bacterium]|nr:metal ABC transporter ATP-binding protein [Bacillota bacterium]